MAFQPPERNIRPAWHLPDELRVAVLASEEVAERRLQGHLMSCEGCRRPLLALAELMPPPSLAQGPADPADCPSVRHSVILYIEEGRSLSSETIDHLSRCEDCGDLFLEPAISVTRTDREEETTGGL